MTRAMLLCMALLVFTLGLALAFQALWPVTPGGATDSDGKLTLDLGGLANGYFQAQADAAEHFYKLRVRCGDQTVTYELPGGAWMVFPLQFGSGEYMVSLYENTGGKKYAAAGTKMLTVTLADETLPFLAPNQYVWYQQDDAVVKLSERICKGKSSDREKLEAIRSYVNGHFKYAFIRTFDVQANTLPDIAYCVKNSEGVYLDLAAMTACMLRVQGIPAKLVLGTLDQQAHAWNLVLLDGQEVLYDPSVEIGGVLGSHYAGERIY